MGKDSNSHHFCLSTPFSSLFLNLSQLKKIKDQMHYAKKAFSFRTTMEMFLSLQYEIFQMVFRESDNFMLASLFNSTQQI